MIGRIDFNTFTQASTAGLPSADMKFCFNSETASRLESRAVEAVFAQFLSCFLMPIWPSSLVSSDHRPTLKSGRQTMTDAERARENSVVCACSILLCQHPDKTGSRFHRIPVCDQLQDGRFKPAVTAALTRSVRRDQSRARCHQSPVACALAGVRPPVRRAAVSCLAAISSFSEKRTAKQSAEQAVMMTPRISRACV